MANRAVTAAQKGWYGTLVAAQEDTVSFANDRDTVEVINRDGAAEIWFRVDGTAAVDSQDCYVVPAAAGAALQVDVTGAGATVVNIISAGTPKVGVLGL